MATESPVTRMVYNIYPSKEVYESLKEQGKLKDGEFHLIEGDDSYEDLDNLPAINGVTVIGDMPSEALGLQDAMSELSTTEIIEIWNKIMNE